MRVVEKGVKTWQTDSRISILSPHTLHDLFRQRRRWYLGLLREQRRNPWPAKVLMSLRLVTWTLALISGVAFFPAWVLIGGVEPPLAANALVAVGTVLYTGGYFQGARNIDAWYWPAHFALFPIYAVVEAFTGPYALLRSKRQFEVIEK
jgi:sterol desaturase/sphingolipid hydroxylase (fatty acid hydroxylase superfamily)